MLQRLTRFVDELIGESPRKFSDDDCRLAVAALLVHLTLVDGIISAAERAQLTAVLRRHFDIDASDTADLIALAVEKDNEAVDLYAFTSVLNRAMSEDELARVVEMMWDVVYADGAADELEDNIVWRAADLLNVSSRERLILKHAAARRRRMQSE